MLSNTLKKISSSRLKSLLQKTTDNPVKGALTGTTVTFLVQSSSVTVLLLIGLVNAGIMNLRQAVYVILGSEIGTTITAQIVAFKVKTIFYPIMVAGFALSVLCPREKLKNGGELLFSLGMIFLAMKIMADGSRPLRDYPLILTLLSDFGVYPILGIAIGAVITAITNSSSATTSLVIAMSMEGLLGLSSGIALIIGANIGTCLLELIATVGTNLAARRTGMAQFLINIFGALLFYPFLDQFGRLVALTATDMPRLLANAHTLFNITVSLIFMPFAGLLLVILHKIIPGRDRTSDTSYGILEEKFLKVPALALYEAEEEINRMASIVGELLQQARKTFFENDSAAAGQLRENEKAVDSIHGNVTGYLNRISTLTLNERDRSTKRALLHVATDLERIGDLAENIAAYSRQEGISFSDAARNDMEYFFNNAGQVFTAAVDSLKMKRRTLETDRDRIENQLRELKVLYREKVVRTLEETRRQRMTDALYPNVVQDIERIVDHANNIAEHILKMKGRSSDSP